MSGISREAGQAAPQRLRATPARVVVEKWIYKKKGVHGTFLVVTGVGAKGNIAGGIYRSQSSGGGAYATPHNVFGSISIERTGRKPHSTLGRETCTRLMLMLSFIEKPTELAKQTQYKLGRQQIAVT